MPEPGRQPPVTPPEALEDLSFELLDIEQLDPREYRIHWRTIADDGYPEITSMDVVVPEGELVEQHLEGVIAERKLARLRANTKARQKREAALTKAAKNKQSAMLNRLKARQDQ